MVLLKKACLRNPKLFFYGITMEEKRETFLEGLYLRVHEDTVDSDKLALNLEYFFKAAQCRNISARSVRVTQTITSLH